MSVGTRGTSQTRSRVRAASSRRPGAGRSRTPQRSRKSGQSSVMGGSVGASSRTSSDMVTTARTAVSSAGQRPEQTMSDCKQQSMAPYNHDSEMPLYTIDQVPEYMRSNPFILRGYRAYYSTYQCIASLLRLHNETFNVWTHLLGGVVFVVLIYSLFVRTLIPEYIQGSTRTSHTLGTQVSGMQHSSGEGASDTTKAWMYPATQGHTPWSLFLFGCFSFACLACMLCSASYHLFTAHLSEPLYNWAHALDYFGITFLIVGSFLPFCYCLFLCVPIWRNTYLTMIMSFGIIGLLGPFFRHWTTDSFAVKKVIFYVCMVGSGIFPILHIRFLPFNVGKPYFARLLTMMVLYGTGVFFYAFKIPERWYPGLFDTYGSSHQIFHVFVLGAAITHFLNCVDMYKNHDKMICPV